MACTTLDLDPEGGDEDFVADIEAVFGLSFTPDQLAGWRTLGDVHTTVTTVLPPQFADGRCPTSMAFHDLRRALCAPDRLLSDASVEAATNGRLKAGYREINRATGLTLPALEWRWNALRELVGLLLFVGSVGTIWALLNGKMLITLFGAAAVALGCGLAWLDPGKPPKGVATLGDLAERVAALNRRALEVRGARAMPGGIWSAIVAVAAEHGRVDPCELAPQTRLLAEAA